MLLIKLVVIVVKALVLLDVQTRLSVLCRQSGELKIVGIKSLFLHYFKLIA